MYAVVDIETTGGNSNHGKITEIAIYIHNGLEVVDEYATLIDPETTIPEFITRLTGISNEMVAGAPKFYEVAKKIVEITEGKIFVAHNSAFDYNFIKAEFRNLGYPFNRDTLCTVKASRKLLPGMPSYSLGKLCAHLGIGLENRHRAGGDALATVRLLELLRMQSTASNLKTLVIQGTLEGKINEHLSNETILALPENTGVYYFMGVENELLYIGKSKNIKDRVMQHLTNPTSKRAREMKARIATIDYEITGSELVALLKESEEIKAKQPIYNKAQLRNSFRYGIYAELRLDGFVHFKYGSIKGKDPIVACSTEEEVRKLLYDTTKKFKLCLQKSGMEPIPAMEKGCFNHGVKLCRGACIGKEKADMYNERAFVAMRSFQYRDPNFMIVSEGRFQEEASVVMVENGRYCGYGYIDTSEGISDHEQLKSCVKRATDNREIGRIIKGYLAKKHKSKVVKW
jgi:DNA polymerase-3 subunit epsilon